MMRAAFRANFQCLAFRAWLALAFQALRLVARNRVLGMRRVPGHCRAMRLSSISAWLKRTAVCGRVLHFGSAPDCPALLAAEVMDEGLKLRPVAIQKCSETPTAAISGKSMVGMGHAVIAHLNGDPAAAPESLDPAKFPKGKFLRL